MSSAALDRALTDPGDPPLLPLPERAEGLLRDLGAPPRLAAHLRAVHDVAHQLVGRLAERCPELPVDRAAVLFGAASHDIGKIIHPAELSGPGSAHEREGYELLVERGIDPSMARFARTHAGWTAPGILIEDLLVSLADKVWKGKRVPDLEQLVVDRIAAAAGSEPWEAFMVLDDIVAELAGDAGRRLAFQAAHPVTV